MIRHPEKAQRYLSFYTHVRSHFKDAVADGGEEMLAALIDRNALEDVPDLQAKLVREDEAFAVALAAASDEWRKQLASWALTCKFGEAVWWRAIATKSAELRTRPIGPAQRKLEQRAAKG